MRHRDQFIKSTASLLEIREDWVDSVVRFSEKETKEATTWASVIEISGLGRLQVRPRKLADYTQRFTAYLNAAQKKLDGLDKDDEKWYAAYKTRNGLQKDVDFLNRKHTDHLASEKRKVKRAEQLTQQDNGPEQTEEHTIEG